MRRNEAQRRALLAAHLAQQPDRADAARKRRPPRRPSSLPLQQIMVRAMRSWAASTRRLIEQLFDYWRTVHLPGLQQRADTADDDRLSGVGAADLFDWLKRTLLAAAGSFWLRGAQIDPTQIPKPVDRAVVETMGRRAASLSHGESLSLIERAGADPRKLRQKIAARSGVALNVSPSNLINIAPTDLHRAEIEGFVASSVELITKVPRDVLAGMEPWLAEKLIEGARPGDIRAGLIERLGISESRAMLIARDQIGKLSGKINETNQRLADVDSYTWMDMDDERVRGNPSGKYPRARPSHHALSGKVFRWSDPPVSGHGGQRLHPGQPIQCRCWPDPVIPADILAD